MSAARSYWNPVFDTRHDRYPVAAHVILRGPDGQVLLMRRVGTDYGAGCLAFPAGHVDLGETPTASIIRETREELGITVAPNGSHSRRCDLPPVPRTPR